MTVRSMANNLPGPSPELSHDLVRHQDLIVVKISLILISGKKYMNGSKTKKKRPLSGAPKGSALASLIPPKIVNPYGNKISNRKSNKNSNSKITQKSSGARIHTSNYDFPDFAVSFKDNPKKRRTIDHSLLQMPKSSHREDSNSTYRNRIKAKQKAKATGKTIANISYRDNARNAVNQKAYTSKLDVKSMEGDYRQAIIKVFKLLDIFNRGKISETNINKWIPEAALYFLGSVFQKIKTCRLTLSVQQFTGLCLPLLAQSNPDDIRQFITQTRIANNIKHPNTSIPEEPKIVEQEMSPIRKRMIMEEMQRSSKKATPSAKRYLAQELSAKKNQMDEVMLGIKNRENEMSQRLNMIQQERRKSVSFNHVLEEIHPNRIIQYDEPQSFQQANPPSYKLSSYNSPQKPMLKSILKSSNKYASPQVPPNSAEQRRLPHAHPEVNDFNSPVVANFTFQLPPEQPARPHFQIKTSNSIVDCQTKQSQLEDFLKLRLDRSQTYEKSHSFTKLDRPHQQLKYEVKSKTHRRQNDSDDIRLQRLHSRIEEYMKRNADKLQRSRMFLQSQRSDAVNIF